MRGIAAILFGWVLGAGLLARAQDAPGSAAAMESARVFYQAGEIAFRAGDFERALAKFRQAYALTQRSGLLYNIGTTADRLRLDEQAIDAFDRYLREVPNTPNRAEVEGRLRLLREVTSRVRENPWGLVQPEAAPRSTYEGPWIIAGGALAVAAAGGALLAVAMTDVAAIEHAPAMSVWDDYRGAYENSEAVSIAGIALIGLGGVCAIAAGVWAWWRAAEDRTEEERAPAFRVSLGWGVLHVAGEF